MLLTLQCCGQDTDGLYKAMENAIAKSEVNCLNPVGLWMYFVSLKIQCACLCEHKTD